MVIPVGNVKDDWWSTFIAFIGACVNVPSDGKFQNIPIPVMSYAVSVGKIVKKIHIYPNSSDEYTFQIQFGRCIGFRGLQ